MNEHHKVLFPAFLIIFASFLAFNLDDFSFSEPNYVVESAISSESSPITGMVVASSPGGTCANDDNTIFGLYGLINSHVAMFGSFVQNDGLYCATLDPAIATTSPTRLCDGNNLIGYVANGSLTSGDMINNAHFYAPETDSANLPPVGEYVDVCYDNVQCTTRNSCLASEECLLSFEGEGESTYNAHVGNCNAYANKLCCSNAGADICAIPDPDVDCDFYDVDYDDPGSAGTMLESQVSDASCTAGCVGDACCEQHQEVCDSSNQCQYFYDLLSNDSWWDNPDVSNAVCYKSNAGLWQWGLSAEGNETACGDLVDNDCDGLVDISDPDCGGIVDNCPNHPNQDGLGTCISNATKSNPNPDFNTQAPIVCSSDEDCAGMTVVPYGGGDPVPVEYCELTQANEDGGVTFGDICGNACDIDSSNPNTCLEEGDQGGEPPTLCGIALQNGNFDWSTSSAVRGEEVEIILDLQGNNDCDGIEFSVQVVNPDSEPGEPDYFSVVTPSPFTVSNGIGTTNWYAENNNPGINPPDAQWKAIGYDGGTYIPPTSILTVSAPTTYCGDGNKDQGEQCDDGNNEDEDGCSETCLTEGLDGAGSNDDCSSYCVKFSKVCSGDGKTVYTCGDWDGNGCNELNAGTLCSGSQTCNTEFGNCVTPGCTVKNFPTTKNPSCTGSYSYVCGSWSDCINGVKTRDCKSCNSGSCSLPPLETVACSLEPSVKGSFFDLWSLLLAISILGIYYVFRNSKVVIK